MFRLGVMASLDDAGTTAEEPEDLLSWADRPEVRVVLLTVLTPEDWDLLGRLCRRHEDVVVVAVLETADPAAQARAVSAGAAAAVARTATRERLRAVLDAAVSGDTLLPTGVVRALAGQAASGQERLATPTSQEIGWLRELATGRTVGQIADDAGYSERMMFRLLRRVYAKLGATERTQALMLAKERGWL